MKTAIVWHPVLDGFKLKLVPTGEGRSQRITIVVQRDRGLFDPATAMRGCEWVEIGRLTVSAYDAEAVLCFRRHQRHAAHPRRRAH